MNKEKYNFHTLKVSYLHITLEAKCPLCVGGGSDVFNCNSGVVFSPAAQLSPAPPAPGSRRLMINDLAKCGAPGILQHGSSHHTTGSSHTITEAARNPAKKCCCVITC